jgi:hypothetical protein
MGKAEEMQVRAAVDRYRDHVADRLDQTGSRKMADYADYVDGLAAHYLRMMEAEAEQVRTRRQKTGCLVAGNVQPGAMSEIARVAAKAVVGSLLRETLKRKREGRNGSRTTADQHKQKAESFDFGDDHHGGTQQP